MSRAELWTLVGQYAHAVLHRIETHSELITAAATLAIAAFTFTLWRTTKKMWLATKQSADAALLAARAAIGIELPIIRAAMPDLMGTEGPVEAAGPYVAIGIDGPAPDPHSIISAVGFRNDGRTSAFPTLLAVGHQVALALAGEPQFRRTILVRPDQIVPAGDRLAIDVHYGMTFTAEEIESMARSEARLAQSPARPQPSQSTYSNPPSS